MAKPRGDFNPRWEAEREFAAYSETRGKSVAVQEAARRRYDAAVVRYERAVLAARAPRWKGSAWDPDPR